MEKTNFIYEKLESFIKKFYTNKLIKGVILFIGLGLLYFLFTLLIEYFLWLPPLGRVTLFFIFIIVEAIFLFFFILIPVLKLLKFQKGIVYKDASAIIGNHFSEVGDKLTNFLQLSNTNDTSELMIRAIEQKANALQPIPFSNAINFKGNIKFLPWLIFPVLLFLVCIVSGNSDIITKSFGRVINYNKQYMQPAPFEFVILNQKLVTEQYRDFILQVKTKGKVVPENVMIFIENESYYLEKNKPDIFEFHFTKPVANINFHLEANMVSSLDYSLLIEKVPTVVNFKMELIFPEYLNKKRETIKGNGNTIVPEGTLVKWEVTTTATKQVEWYDYTEKVSFLKENNLFYYTKNIFQNTDYQILTSNNEIKDYEKLNYKISVIKDQFPFITVANAPDSLKLDKNIVLGQVLDDYGLSKLQLVYYPKERPEKIIKISIPVKSTDFDQFYYAFPGDLKVERGIFYDYYFEVFDNDVLHHFKSTKSTVFSHREVTDEEHEDQLFQNQNTNINSLSQAVKDQDKQLNDLNDLQKLGKEKNSLEFKDQQKINTFIKRQKIQDEMMRSFSKKMEENLAQFKTEDKDEFKEKLKERFKNTDKEVDRNDKLLEELKGFTDKIKEEELFDRVEKLKQSSKNQIKNLEQLVELTKRYYIHKKTEQLVKKLENLAQKQEDISISDKDNTSENQKDINILFNKFKEDLEALKKENAGLKKPIEMVDDPAKEKNIDNAIEKALDALNDNKKELAMPEQKKASEMMKSLSKVLKEEMAASEGEQLEEDVKMLRQILDNLLAFSFAQEDLMVQFKELKRGSPSYNKYLKMQQNLKQQFKHVDDSLFAMSLRNPSVDDLITKEVGEVHYNLNKAIETLSDAIISKGVSHQQYAISSANKLADFLSTILGNMQDKMQINSKPGEGSMQLPDIIKKQQGLGEKMQRQMQKGNNKSQGKEGENGEGEAQALFEIYKEQQHLKEALQKVLEEQGMSNNGKEALDKMDKIEKNLLNKGFKNETVQKMLNLNYELLKLDNAVREEGEDAKRQSKVNAVNYNNPNKALPLELQEYLNSVEILNRQSLPLRPDYNKKVQKYFKKDD